MGFSRWGGAVKRAEVMVLPTPDPSRKREGGNQRDLLPSRLREGLGVGRALRVEQVLQAIEPRGIAGEQRVLFICRGAVGEALEGVP
ncbi:hypothetical protein NSE01_06490 [Novosphingobium sediminis]|uniref:Uncharacterized protein n=1 Tax=Novosphingobium sediminis TaxID=707214 RepID=A0A512AGN1_9SPHN|nr:hypothetical protein NSE01_06490 [Novosphingobium sediminis]